MLAEGCRLLQTGVSEIQCHAESQVGVGGGHQAGQTAETGAGTEGGGSARLRLLPSIPPSPVQLAAAQRKLEDAPHAYVYATLKSIQSACS